MRNCIIPYSRKVMSEVGSNFASQRQFYIASGFLPMEACPLMAPRWLPAAACFIVYIQRRGNNLSPTPGM